MRVSHANFSGADLCAINAPQHLVFFICFLQKFVFGCNLKDNTSNIKIDHFVIVSTNTFYLRVGLCFYDDDDCWCLGGQGTNSEPPLAGNKK